MTAPTPKQWATVPLPEWNPSQLLGYAEAKAKAERGESLFPARVKAQPWARRSLASLQDEHDELIVKRDRLGVTGDDTAAAMLSHRDARRETSRMDRDLSRYARLTERIDFLAFRIRNYPKSSPSADPGRSVVGASLPASPQVSDQPGGTKLSESSAASVPQPSNGFPPGSSFYPLRSGLAPEPVPTATRSQREGSNGNRIHN